MNAGMSTFDVGVTNDLRVRVPQHYSNKGNKKTFRMNSFPVLKKLLTNDRIWAYPHKTT